ncbi:MAG: indole-3-glycerol-phosphate synthase [Acidobacteria bacterium]|nr:indole-3-glycerol-phosphate synthase [Acidobacteriota bacterium]MYA47368.1 indole-3-glycerol-phosphate synthase [Acidobacteriota bacterium]MYI39135.1 indole-3-glycerol-phosphate synthase [Acidobacteriota bacterium]
MTERVLERLVRAAEARAERLAAEPDPGPPDGEPPSFRDAIGGRDALSVIAEFKRKSPSAGSIRDDDPGARALAYREAGASAVSVLTDPDGFGGSLTDLQTASAASGLPILMKDFVVDPAQVRAGWAAGASAVLLIVRCLDDARLRRLHREARSLGLDTLVEVHDAAELDRALALEDAIVGINNRDLDTLETDRRRARDLLPRLPSGRIAVAESGYLEPEHLTELRGRADAVLIGTALMRAADPSAFLRAATEPVPAGV